MLIATTSFAMTPADAAPVPTDQQTVVSAPKAGTADGQSSTTGHAITDDGRYVVFASDATNLVAGDTNGVSDVFLSDLRSGLITRLSTAPDGSQAEGESRAPCVSADGRTVAFITDARSLSGMSSTAVVVKDLRSRALATASLLPPGAPSALVEGCSLSGSGRYLAFEAWWDEPNAPAGGVWEHCYLYDRSTGTTTLVSVDNDGTSVNGSGPSISRDGTKLSWTSRVPSDRIGAWALDAQVRDVATGRNTLVSASRSGAPGDDNSHAGPLSADGRFVVFTSSASDLVPGDTNGLADIFVRDMLTATTARIPVGAGEYVPEITGTAISADGTTVAFTSGSNDVVASDHNDLFSNDVFVTNLVSGTTRLITRNNHGWQSNAEARGLSLRADGAVVVYTTRATNLVDAPLPAGSNVLLHDMTTAAPMTTGDSAPPSTTLGVRWSHLNKDSDTWYDQWEPKLTCTDDTSGCGDSSIEYDGVRYLSSPVPDGKHDVTWWSWDLAGNREVAHHQEVDLDREAPTGTFVSPTYGEDFALPLVHLVADVTDLGSGVHDVAFHATNVDGTPVDYNYGASESTPGRWSADAVLPPGRYWLYATAHDNVNRLGVWSGPTFVVG